jgi:lipopolysaccharide export system permease protein
MKLLTRYTLRTFSRYLLLSMAAFTGLFLLVDFLDKIDNFTEHHASIDLYFSYFFALIPGILSQMAPLAALLAVFLTLGGFNRTSELTAMMAGGLSIWRIIRPLCIAGALISILIMLNNEFLVPWTAQTANHVLRAQVKGKPITFTTRGNICFRQDSSYVNVRFFNAPKELLKGVRVFKFDNDSQLVGRIDATSAFFDNASQKWQLQECTSYQFTDNGKNISHYEQLDSLDLKLDKTPTDLKTVAPKTEEMTYRQLNDRINQLQAEGFDPGSYRVAMHQHLAAPFAAFVMVLLGIPFALKRGRNSGMAIGVAVSVAVGVGYFIVNATVVAFGASGKIPPFAAAWFANVLFTLLAVGLLYRRRI